MIITHYCQIITLPELTFVYSLFANTVTYRLYTDDRSYPERAAFYIVLYTFAEKAPEFTVNLRDKHAVEEETVEFTFQLNKPNVQVKWTRDGQPLPDDDRFRTVSEGTLYKLVIDNCKLEDQLQYTATLPDGKTSSAKLTVEGKHTVNCMTGNGLMMV